MSTHYTSPNQLVKAASLRSISGESPFWFGNLIHVYLELKLNLKELEGAESVTKAKQALDYIRKAADAADLASRTFGGQVLEIHGRTIHVGIPYDSDRDVEELTYNTCALMHILLKKAYGNGGPEGWRMAGAHAATLTVTSEGIHGDNSLVSLSPAANYPAKALGKKKVPLWHLGVFIRGNWKCDPLDEIAVRQAIQKTASQNLNGGSTLEEQVMEKRAKVVNFSSLSEIRQVNMQAVDVDSDGTGPTVDSPFSCFGFVLSMDLDGFTKRVDRAAQGSPEEQRQLAFQFLGIMQDAKGFAENHEEFFIQFPFAGDNAIFAVTAKNISEFEVLKKRKPVEIAVEWEQAMGDKAREADFGGWGQASAAGGLPHGNSKGNLHIGGIILGNQRFLVGIGPGMRFTRQAFAHVEPKPDEHAMSSCDIGGLHPTIAAQFSECTSNNGGTSSYYRKAKLASLTSTLNKMQSEDKLHKEALKVPYIQLSGTTAVNRPYFKSQ